VDSITLERYGVYNTVGHFCQKCVRAQLKCRRITCIDMLLGPGACALRGASNILDKVIQWICIGGDNFLMGCRSIEWVRAEYAEMDIQRLPERTLLAIIARLWKISWDLWLGRNAAV
jgi:hypothetical protein